MTTPTWLDEEEKNLTKPFDGDRLPSLKLEPNKITEVIVDYSAPFGKWEGEQGGKKIKKAIVPVTVADEKKNFWINTKNPLYASIVKGGKAGQVKYKIVATGSQADTRYNLVD